MTLVATTNYLLKPSNSVTEKYLKPSSSNHLDLEPWSEYSNYTTGRAVIEGDLLPKADRTLFLNGSYVWECLCTIHQTKGPLFTISQFQESTYFSLWLTLVIPASEKISSAERATLLKGIFSDMQISRDEILASKFESHLVADKEDGKLDRRALADPITGWMDWQERELLEFKHFKHWDYFELRLEIEYYDESLGEAVDWSEPEFYLETHQSFVALRSDISAEGYLESLAANSRQLQFPELSADYG